MLAFQPMSNGIKTFSGGRAQAKKSLGQHFLKDAQAVRRMVDLLPAGARVLEIGPGPGALTEHLIKKAGALTLIEADNRFAAYWTEQAEQHSQLAVVHADVLKVLEEVVERCAPEWIVGNLPYNISGPLTAQLAALQVSGGMILMYQKEVAERLRAGPGSKVYGGLSVLVQHHYEIKKLLNLPPGAFLPPPKVHSQVVVLTPHGREPSCSFEALQRTVRQGFAHRRKTLSNNFKGVLDAGDWQRLDIDASKRPEQLGYDVWASLATYRNPDQ